jgi:hypothetical protein
MKKKIIPYKTILVSLVIVALLGVTVAQAAGLSLLDKIAQYAGQVLGNRAYEDLKGDLLPISDELIGAVSGTDHYNIETFWAGLGGNTLATSSYGAAVTMNADQLNKYTAFEITPQTVAPTYTLPATSTLSGILKDIGSTKTWYWQNATTSTGINVTLAAGTGWNLSGVDGNVDVWPGAAYTARELIIMTCYRQVNTDINCELRENVAAD